MCVDVVPALDEPRRRQQLLQPLETRGAVQLRQGELARMVRVRVHRVHHDLALEAAQRRDRLLGDAPRQCQHGDLGPLHRLGVGDTRRHVA